MRSCVLFILFLISMPVWSQQAYVIKNLRFEEDFSFLKEDSSKTFYKQIKYVPIDSKSHSWLSLGGEYRWQYQNFINEDWGDRVSDPNGFILSRLLVHADLHLGKRLRLFAQLKNNTIHSREGAIRSIDQNILGLHQGFAIFNFGEDFSSELRLGRQEMSLGSQRLVATREGPNNRLSFDGVRYLREYQLWSWSAFYMHPVLETPDIFDGGFNRESNLFGVYTVRKNGPVHLNYDFYYLGVYHQNARFDRGVGEELRHSIGMRFWKNSAKWIYDFEAVYQFGYYNSASIQAYTLSTNANYVFSLWNKKSTLGIKTEVISGDGGEEALMTAFNPLYPRGAYFGLAALLGPVNLLDFHPSFILELSPKLSFNIDYDLFWRYSLNDGIYGPNVRPIYTGQTSDQRYIGAQLGVFANYRLRPFLSMVLEGTWFQPGAYLQDVSAGNDMIFTAFTFQFKY